MSTHPNRPSKAGASNTAQGRSREQQDRQLNRFLAEVERRAFRMAEVATGNREDALEIVQEAMLKLVQRYANREEAEWGPLFHRILQNGIRDWYRRSKIRNQVLGWLGRRQDDDQDDPIQTAPDVARPGPGESAANRDAMVELTTALHALPLRQQQAFLLRAWEGLNVAETAQAMKCSAGSVKTHYSRALKTLRTQLKDYRS